MDAMTEVEPDQSVYQLYENARDTAAKYHKALVSCLYILDMEADRRAREGRDELNLRDFTARIRGELSA